MKNICMRDRFNRKISDNIKQEIYKLNLNSIKFNNLHNSSDQLLKNEFYKLKFVFDFNIENEYFLEDIKDAIDKGDSKKLIDLCDSYEFRFFKIFDYVIENVVININFNNFDNILNVFIDLFKNGESKNSLNLSVFILSFFCNNEINNFCKNFLCGDLDYLEVCSFILRDDNLGYEITYFSLFKHFYGKFKIIDIIKKLNKNYFGSYLKFIVSFYLFNIKNFDIRCLNNLELKAYLEYILNYKKSIEKLSSKFLFLNNFDEFKFMIIDLEFVLEKIGEIFKEVNYFDDNEIDIELCCFGMQLFGVFDDCFLDYNFKNLIYNELIEGLYDKNYNKCKDIISIYNILDIDISEEIYKIFNKEYDSEDFLKTSLKVFRGYKYFCDILNQFEKNVYLTKLINDFEFRNLFFRNLIILYGKFDFKIVGVNFLKIVMDYEEFYNEKSSYINFIVQKILERSYI